VLQHRLAPADLLQRQLATFVVQLFEPVEAVPAVAHHFAGLANITKLLGQLEQTNLRSDDLLILRHCCRLRTGCRRAGRGPRFRGEPRPAPRPPLPKPTTTVTLNTSHLRYVPTTATP